MDYTFGYNEAGTDSPFDEKDHNTGASGADGIPDGITERMYYKRDGSGDVPLYTLHEPKVHPAGGTPITDAMIGSAFYGVGALGTNGLYTKGDATSRPNQPDSYPKPGWDGGDYAHLAIPAIASGEAPPQAGYYSLRAENLTPGCSYTIGVTYEIVHVADQGFGAGDADAPSLPTKVCSYGGNLIGFTATCDVNYLGGQEDGKNHLNTPTYSNDWKHKVDGEDVTHPLAGKPMHKCVTSGSNFFHIPYAQANATTGCGGQARNDGYAWSTHTLTTEGPPPGGGDRIQRGVIKTVDGEDILFPCKTQEEWCATPGISSEECKLPPYAGGTCENSQEFGYRADQSDGSQNNFTAGAMTRAHEYVVYISGLYIQEAGVLKGKDEVLPHFIAEGGVVTHVQQPIGANCVIPPNTGGDPDNHAFGNVLDGEGNPTGVKFGFQPDPPADPLEVGDPAPVA